MYTSHGHQIPGTTAEEGPRPEVARCGGPRICRQCEQEAKMALRTQPNVPRSPILRYFVFDHLPEKLQATSRPFHDLAEALEILLPPGPEKSVALRKLLESKDAAVRAALDQ